MTPIPAPSMAVTLTAERNSHDLARDHLGTARIVIRHLLSVLERPKLTDIERGAAVKIVRSFMDEFGGGL